MPNGYMGKMLLVDLSSGEIKNEPLDEKLAQEFIGGYGLGAKILYDRMKPKADPLGPENILGFTTGPLTGTKSFFSGRFVVVCKSPASGTWNDSNSGGYFGPELKRAGYDAVFFTGSSEKPVYLWIHNGKAELRDAAKYWGMDSNETLDALIQDTGEPKLRAALIGPAGENLSLMASVMDDRHRAAARGGCGAVMGSKKLKAIVVRGTMEVPVANPERLLELNKTVAEAMKSGPGAKRTQGTAMFGTGSGTGFAIMLGDTPVKNWNGVGTYDLGPDMHNLSTTSHPEYQTKKYNCSTCPLGCGMRFEVKEGKWPMESTERPEYETLASFGACCGNADFEAVLKCNDLCNRAGMDTISVGATVAWAIECFENGIINKDDTCGIELRWGNADAVVQMTEAIAKNEGFGKILKLGSAAASKKLGVGGEYLVTASGIELAMHDPRCCPGMARTYQYDPTPGRHTKGGLGLTQIGNPSASKYSCENTGEADYNATVYQEVLECAGLCQFLTYTTLVSAPMDYVEAVTGMSTEEQMAAGARVLNMRHLFNIREGFRRSDFTISDRAVGKPSLEQGPTAGRTIDNEKLGDNFFAMAGWNLESGIPDFDRLKALGLAETAAELYAKIGAES